LKEIFLTVAGQRRIHTDFPQSHSFTSILNCWQIVVVIACEYNSTRAVAPCVSEG
jgi:hypothetical protein